MSDDWAAWLCGGLSGGEGGAEPAAGSDLEGSRLVAVRSHPEASGAKRWAGPALVRGLDDVQGAAAGAVVPALRLGFGGGAGRPPLVSPVLRLWAGCCDARRTDDLPLPQCLGRGG